ncbi:hypothetical protein CERZMDRAFT_91609 [Cercospora zeae-maydis SCOH1-5]|uniref:Uncharacterized protein n=1 Tax=Cercospora zeae-maydis SCOH1-5 TaxID=717836 RepID=A0A6A6F3H0_9PEZI|nr:hypothetical protein CERZMDRAFT_91609 [Cercospora zeae-maydis SCOH1-5]
MAEPKLHLSLMDRSIKNPKLRTRLRDFLHSATRDLENLHLIAPTPPPTMGDIPWPAAIALRQYHECESHASETHWLHRLQHASLCSPNVHSTNASWATWMCLDAWHKRVLQRLSSSPSRDPESWLREVILPRLRQLYLLLDHLAPLLDACPSVQGRELAPILEHLRYIELRYLVAYGMTVSYAELRRAQDRYAARLAHEFARDSLAILSPYSSQLHNKTLAVDQVLNIAQAAAQTPPGDILSRLADCIRHPWKAKQVWWRRASEDVFQNSQRRWALDTFAGCMLDAPPPALRNNHTAPPPVQETDLLGCDSHPSPFLRTWFAHSSYMPLHHAATASDRHRVGGIVGSWFVNANHQDLLERPGLLHVLRRRLVRRPDEKTPRRATVLEMGWLRPRCVRWWKERVWEEEDDGQSAFREILADDQVDGEGGGSGQCREIMYDDRNGGNGSGECVYEG